MTKKKKEKKEKKKKKEKKRKKKKRISVPPTPFFLWRVALIWCWNFRRESLASKYGWI